MTAGSTRLNAESYRMVMATCTSAPIVTPPRCSPIVELCPGMTHLAEPRPRLQIVLASLFRSAFRVAEIRPSLDVAEVNRNTLPLSDQESFPDEVYVSRAVRVMAGQAGDEKEAFALA